MGRRVDVGDDGDSTDHPAGRLQLGGERLGGGPHERGVEGSAHLEWDDLAKSEGRRLLPQRRDLVSSTGHNRLTGRIAIGHHDSGEVDDRGIDRVVISTEHGDHGARLDRRSFGHGEPSMPDQSGALVPREDAGGTQRGVLTQTVADGQIKRKTSLGDGIGDRCAQRERGQLGVVRANELIERGVDEEVSHVDTGGVGDSVDRAAGGMIHPRHSHARAEGTLPGEQSDDHGHDLLHAGASLPRRLWVTGG